MQVIARLVLSIAAIVVGNMMIPDGTAVDVLSTDANSNPVKLFGGTVLIIIGAFVFARTAVAAFKAHFLNET